jgi:hypothetical protein
MHCSLIHFKALAHDLAHRACPLHLPLSHIGPYFNDFKVADADMECADRMGTSFVQLNCRSDKGLKYDPERIWVMENIRTILCG